MSSKDYIDLSQFRIIEEIGEGSFGKVHLVEDVNTHKKYATKNCKSEIDESSQNSQGFLNIFREVKIMSALNHAAIILYAGFSPFDFDQKPYPTIITEYCSNGTLQNIFDLESKSLTPANWDDTKRLICIYGIASGMLFLHNHGIIHRDLKPANILMDESLFPKIADFGLAKIIDKISQSLEVESKKGFKGTFLYSSPEILINEIYSPPCDVYAFAMIVYQIITQKVPFNCTPVNLMMQVANGKRPEFDEDTPPVYKELIKRCWEQSPNDRPTFKEIVDILKNDKGFITENVDEDEFLEYVDDVDNYENNFHLKTNFHLSSFLSPKKNEAKINEMEETNAKVQEEKEPVKLEENEIPTKKKIMYPYEDFENLDNENKNLVKEAENDEIKQFIVGKYLINGNRNFPQNTQLGIKYLRTSMMNGCDESAIFLSKIYIDGDIVATNLDEARIILEKVEDSNDADVQLLLGRIEKKEKNYEKAIQHLHRSSFLGNCNAMHKYGKMCLKGKELKKMKRQQTNIYRWQ